MQPKKQTNDTKAIEVQMLVEVREIVAENRTILDLIGCSARSQIAAILNYGPLSTDAWLVTPCSYLDGDRPIDILSYDQEKVFAAARRRKQRTQHG